MRELTARLIVPLLKWTGFRFDKSFRHAEGNFKAFIFRHIINTTRANQIAEGY